MCSSPAGRDREKVRFPMESIDLFYLLGGQKFRGCPLIQNSPHSAGGGLTFHGLGRARRANASDLRLWDGIYHQNVPRCRPPTANRQRHCDEPRNTNRSLTQRRDPPQSSNLTAALRSPRCLAVLASSQLSSSLERTSTREYRRYELELPKPTARVCSVPERKSGSQRAAHVDLLRDRFGRPTILCDCHW
jgi:hypothetical protein